MDNNLALKIESIASMKVILSCDVISMKGERTRYRGQKTNAILPYRSGFN